MSDAPDDAPAETEPFAGLPLESFDELAGVVDLFGALSRREVVDACEELAYRAGETVDAGAVDAVVDAAIEQYYLVECGPAAVESAADGVGRVERAGDGADGDSGDTDTDVLAVGPVAFPSLPADAEDLPHILEFPTRAVDRAALARDVEGRLRGDAARAVAAEETARIEHLLDVTYDLEAWAAVDVSEVRERLDDALDA